MKEKARDYVLEDKVMCDLLSLFVDNPETVDRVLRRIADLEERLAWATEEVWGYRRQAELKRERAHELRKKRKKRNERRRREDDKYWRTHVDPLEDVFKTPRKSNPTVIENYRIEPQTK